MDRANAGRTTFYLSYRGRDDIFMSCHEAIVGELRIGPLHPRAPCVRSTQLSPARPWHAPCRGMPASRLLPLALAPETPDSGLRPGPQAAFASRAAEALR